ncbi:MAG: hypothetical protein ACLUSL_12330 [Ruminococcus sp.]
MSKDENGIATASWHINVPIDFDKYELGDEVDWQKCTYKNYQVSNSTFNTANAVKEGHQGVRYFQEYIGLGRAASVTGCRRSDHSPPAA